MYRMLTYVRIYFGVIPVSDRYMTSENYVDALTVGIAHTRETCACARHRQYNRKYIFIYISMFFDGSKLDIERAFYSFSEMVSTPL